MPNGGSPTGADLARNNSGNIRELAKRLSRLEAEVEELRSQIRKPFEPAYKYPPTEKK